VARHLAPGLMGHIVILRLPIQCC